VVLVRNPQCGLACLETALETHKRTTAMLRLDVAVEFRAVVADLRERYVRYNHAFAVFPNLSSRTYVPQRRVKTGEITRIADGDSVRAQGGFLKLGPGVSRRLVRQVGPGCVSDVRAILDYPSDQIDAFELCLSEYVDGTVVTANIR
jgi:hypothetical protein